MKKYSVIKLQGPMTMTVDASPFTSELCAITEANVLNKGLADWNTYGKWAAGFVIQHEYTYYGIVEESEPDTNEYGEVAP